MDNSNNPIHFIYIIIISIILLYILSLQECASSYKPTITSSTKIDTITIHHTDTIKFTDTIYKYKVVKIYPPIIEIDGKGDSLYNYTTDITDELLDGTIVSTTKGELINQVLTYRPKFPKYIIKTDTVIINKDIINNIDKEHFKLLLGAEVGGNLTQFDISPVIGLHTRKGYDYNYRYGLVSKTHNITFIKTFSLGKNK